MSLKYYVDIDCREAINPDDEGEGDFLMTQVLTGIHQAIVTECGSEATRQNKVAVCFPFAKGSRHGSLVRMFFLDADVAGRILRNPWLHRFAVGFDVLPVPPQHTFQLVFRNRQEDSTSPSKRRREAARKLKLGEKLPYLPQVNEALKGFMVRVKSSTTKQEFPMIICQKAVDEPAAGAFSAYGFSSVATQPLF